MDFVAAKATLHGNLNAIPMRSALSRGMRFSLALVICLLSHPVIAAPASSLWEYWLGHDPASARVVDHMAWDGFLRNYVVAGADGIARVSYGSVTLADRSSLRGYIDHLAVQRVRQLNRGEQQALWINLYNALTVMVVLDHFPVASIRDIRISPGLFSSGPWGKKLLAIDGQTVSLDDIEHRILRPIWRDPRLHYALNCASLGCPDLQTEAFTAANTEALLDRAARSFINHPRAVQITGGGSLRVSSIYTWFRDDFGGTDEAVLQHLSRYAAPPLAQRLAGQSRIGSDAYDWALNAAP